MDGYCIAAAAAIRLQALSMLSRDIPNRCPGLLIGFLGMPAVIEVRYYVSAVRMRRCSEPGLTGVMGVVHREPLRRPGTREGVVVKGPERK